MLRRDLSKKERERGPLHSHSAKSIDESAGLATMMEVAAGGEREVPKRSPFLLFWKQWVGACASLWNNEIKTGRRDNVKSSLRTVGSVSTARFVRQPFALGHHLITAEKESYEKATWEVQYSKKGDSCCMRLWLLFLCPKCICSCNNTTLWEKSLPFPVLTNLRVGGEKERERRICC